MVRRRTAPREDRTPLDLACALLRYGRLTCPIRAYERMHAEWPPDVARVLDKVLWTEVKIAHRSVEDVAAELHALNRKAEADAQAVRALMRAEKLSVAAAVAKVVAARERRHRRRSEARASSRGSMT